MGVQRWFCVIVYFVFVYFIYLLFCNNSVILLIDVWLFIDLNVISSGWGFS